MSRKAIGSPLRTEERLSEIAGMVQSSAEVTAAGRTSHHDGTVPPPTAQRPDPEPVDVATQ